MEEFGIVPIACADESPYDCCAGHVRLTHCPYAEDIDGEIVPVWLCMLHEQGRMREV